MISSNLVSDFKRPKNAQYKVISQDKMRVEFSAGPYEKGFALTMGNALRRTLLSGLSGHAVVAIKFDTVSSEYENIPGVREDTTLICVNLKKVAVGLSDSEIKNKVLDFEIKGETTFTAGDIAKDKSILIGNPDDVIFHANEDANFSFRLQISQGRGYVASETIERNIEVPGTIPLDADYSPVNSVGFEILPISMHTHADFEKLMITIESKGVLAPETALELASRTLKECLLTFTSIEAEAVTTSIDMTPIDGRSDEDKIFHESVHSLEVRVPTHYFLKVNGFIEIGELVTENDNDMRSRKRFSEDILEDIIAKLGEKSLSLGMKGVNYIKKEY